MFTNHSSTIAALEDLVCFPTKQMHTFIRYRSIPSHSLFLQEMGVNCYIFVALVSLGKLSKLTLFTADCWTWTLFKNIQTVSLMNNKSAGTNAWIFNFSSKSQNLHDFNMKTLPDSSHLVIPLVIWLYHQYCLMQDKLTQCVNSFVLNDVIVPLVTKQHIN